MTRVRSHRKARRVLRLPSKAYVIVALLSSAILVVGAILSVDRTPPKDSGGGVVASSTPQLETPTPTSVPGQVPRGAPTVERLPDRNRPRPTTSLVECVQWCKARYGGCLSADSEDVCRGRRGSCNTDCLSFQGYSVKSYPGYADYHF
jgi:hypothetical protein